jgi:hypothetical protein
VSGEYSKNEGIFVLVIESQLLFGETEVVGPSKFDQSEKQSKKKKSQCLHGKLKKFLWLNEIINALGLIRKEVKKVLMKPESSLAC